MLLNSGDGLNERVRKVQFSGRKKRVLFVIQLLSLCFWIAKSRSTSPGNFRCSLYWSQRMLLNQLSWWCIWIHNKYFSFFYIRNRNCSIDKYCSNITLFIWPSCNDFMCLELLCWMSNISLSSLTYIHTRTLFDFLLLTPSSYTCLHAVHTIFSWEMKWGLKQKS